MHLHSLIFGSLEVSQPQFQLLLLVHREQEHFKARKVDATHLFLHLFASCFRLRGIPIWAFHGNNDVIVPSTVSKELIEALWNAGANKDSGIADSRAYHV